MTYTPKQLADLSGVSVRTLHHYHKIELLVPDTVSDKNYRRYSIKDAQKLQQILFFRELDFPLQEIKQIVNSKQYVAEQALLEQKNLLQLEQDRLTSLIQTITTTLTTMKSTSTPTDSAEQLTKEFEAFERKNITEYKNELLKKYDADVVQNSLARVQSWSPEHKATVLAEAKTIVQQIASTMHLGASSDSVQQHIADYHAHMNRFYDCSLEIFRELGRMYVSDSRFTKYYEDVSPGLADFIQLAISHYVDQQQ